MRQTGLNAYVPKNPVIDISSVTDQPTILTSVSTAHESSHMTTAEIILQKEQKNGDVSVGFVLDSAFDNKDHFYHASTYNYIEEHAVNSSYLPLDNGKEMGVYETSSTILAAINDIRNRDGTAQPLTSDTHYTVSVTGTDTTISAYITNNITGVTQPLGSIYRRHLAEGAPKHKTSILGNVKRVFSSAPHYSVSYAENSVMQDFTKKMAKKIRDIVGNK
jgi:hypothetical protein